MLLSLSEIWKKDANHDDYDDDGHDDGKEKVGNENEEEEEDATRERSWRRTVTWTFLTAVAYSSYVDCLL